MFEHVECPGGTNRSSVQLSIQQSALNDLAHTTNDGITCAGSRFEKDDVDALFLESEGDETVATTYIEKRVVRWEVSQTFSDAIQAMREPVAGGFDLKA